MITPPSLNIDKGKSTSYTTIIYIALFLVLIYLLIWPLILSIDSVYGFLAYKGTLNTSQFNVLQEVSFENINQIDSIFVSWWSPGQWMLPALLTSITGIKLGISCILVTVFCALFGLFGYKKLFQYFGFSPTINGISTLLILLSNTLYQNFIIYQGGEIISFAIAPWFMLYILQLNRYNIFSLLTIALLIICCFIAKTTMIVYVTIVIGYNLLSAPGETVGPISWRIKINSQRVLLLIPLLLSIGFIYLFYIQKGPSPTLFNHFHFDKEDLLVPLSAPVMGLFSIHPFLSRIETIVEHSVGNNLAGLFFTTINVLIAFFSICLIWKIYRYKSLPIAYRKLIILLFLGLSCFFGFAYLFNTNIDYSVRHFKLFSFLLIPFIIQWLSKISSNLPKVLLFVCLLLFISDLVISKRNWINNRYLSRNYFFRNFDNRILVDSLDEISYNKVIQLDRNTGTPGNPDSPLFIIEASPDIALDIKNQCVFVDNRNDFYTNPYHGNGTGLIIAISKKTINEMPGFIKFKFPDYPFPTLIDSTSKYLIYKSSTPE